MAATLNNLKNEAPLIDAIDLINNYIDNIPRINKKDITEDDRKTIDLFNQTTTRFNNRLETIKHRVKSRLYDIVNFYLENKLDDKSWRNACSNVRKLINGSCLLYDVKRGIVNIRSSLELSIEEPIELFESLSKANIDKVAGKCQKVLNEMQTEYNSLKLSLDEFSSNLEELKRSNLDTELYAKLQVDSNLLEPRNDLRLIAYHSKIKKRLANEPELFIAHSASKNRGKLYGILLEFKELYADYQKLYFRKKMLTAEFHKV